MSDFLLDESVRARSLARSFPSRCRRANLAQKDGKRRNFIAYNVVVKERVRNCRKTRHKTPLSADEQADMQAKIQYQGVSARETSFDAQGLNESERGPGYFTR